MTPWPRDDPAEMFALVAVPCNGATGVAVPTKRKKKKENEEKEVEEKVDKEETRGWRKGRERTRRK